MAKNKHKVDVDIWEMWTPEGQKIFNRVMKHSKDPELFLHCSLQDIGLFAGKKGRKQWKVTRFNFAFVAAMAASGIDNIEYV
jgi:hypothetical protein